MEQFMLMVKNALFNNDNIARATAEKQVSDFLIQDPPHFLEYAATILANEASDSQLRQGCGTLLVRALRMAGKQTAFVWFDLDEKLKITIKTALMITLVTKIIIVRRAAATAIASICGLELPAKQWPEIIPVLTNNSSNSDTEVKKAALMTLGFICEELKNTGNANCLDAKQIETIMMGILIGMVETETNNEIREFSIKACHDSLNFMEALIERKEIRDYLMKSLIFSLSIDDKNVRVKTAQCLIDFSKLHYNKLDEYINMFIESLSPLIMHSDEEIAIPAIEVFNTIAIEDKERDSTRQFSNVQNQINNSLLLTKRIYQKLIPLLIQNLLRSPNDNDGDLNLQDTTTKCLSSIVEVIADDSLEILGEFISRTIEADSWIQRQAAIIAFSSLLEGPSKDKIENMIQVVLEKIVNLLQDKHDRVKLAASTTLCRIAEIYPLSILNHAFFAKISEILAALIASKPKISRNICWTISFLADSFPNIDIPHHPIAQTADLILQNLYKNTLRVDLTLTDVNVVDISFMALINVLHYINEPNLASKYLYIFIDQYKNTYTMPNVSKSSLQSGLLSAIHTALLRIPEVNDNLGMKVYELVIEDFKIKKEVTSDGIYAMSALSGSWKNGFLSHLDEYWNYLIFALGKQEDIELFKSAIGSLADLSRSCESGFEKYLPQVVPALIKCLHSPDIHRELKLHIFLCLGDIALGCKFAILPFMEEIKKIFDIAFAAAIEISKDNDSLDYAEQLKDKLVESYICFVHCLGATEQGDILLDHFPNLFAFLTKVSNNDLNPTVDFLRNVLALIADIANFYKKKVLHLVKTQFTQDLINTLQRFIHIKENELMIKYAVHVIQTL